MRHALSAIVLLAFLLPSAYASQESYDLCSDKPSNVEITACYEKEQVRVNAQADTVARKIARKWRQDAAKYLKDDPAGTTTSKLMRKTASAVLLSQRTWKEYRNQHCKAVSLSYTTGSGNGAGYEACMYELGVLRVQQLQRDFVDAVAVLPDEPTH